MNQDLYIRERLVDAFRSGWFSQLGDDAGWWAQYDRRCRYVVDRFQRKNGLIVLIVYRRMVIGVTVRDAVRCQMAMDDRVNMPLFIGFVHMLGRNDGKQSQRGA